MNDRPWWKLSWPAVVAGLVMLGTLVVKNFLGDDVIFGSSWQLVHREYGWPLKCVMTETVSEIVWTPDSDGTLNGETVFGPTSVETTSPGGLAVNGLCGVFLILGPLCSIERWHRSEVIRFTITVRGLLATTSCAAVFLAMARARVWLFSIEPLATGVVFVGIFLACVASSIGSMGCGRGCLVGTAASAE